MPRLAARASDEIGEGYAVSQAGLRIAEVIQPATVDLCLKGIHDKDELIRYLADLLYQAGKLRSVGEFLDAVRAREALGPTYMEHYVAIPHGKSDAVLEAGVAFGRSTEGIWYETEHGGGLAKLVFLLAIPDQMSPDAYIAVLARLARLLVHEEFRDALHAAVTYEDVFQAVVQGESLLEHT
jgi:mannitol/fructose-specific phosphotransferase system IIA component (Ntr-type)